MHGCSSGHNSPTLSKTLSQAYSGEYGHIMQALNVDWVSFPHASVAVSNSRSDSMIETLYAELVLRYLANTPTPSRWEILDYTLSGESDEPYLYQLVESTFVTQKRGSSISEGNHVDAVTVTIAYCINGIKSFVGAACLRDFDSAPLYRKFEFGKQTRFKINTPRYHSLPISQQIHWWKSSMINSDRDKIVGVQVTRVFASWPFGGNNQEDDIKPERSYPLTMYMTLT